jgi:hypothetical protein
METRTTRRGRLSAGVLAGGLLLVPMAACGGSEPADVDAAPDVTATETAAPDGTDGGADVTEPEETAGTTEPEETAGTAGQTDGTGADVDCSGNTCAVTLSGDGAEAEILGTSVVLGSVENGRATFRVGDRELSCGQGESVSAGPLTLECSTVTEDTVTMTASLG